MKKIAFLVFIFINIANLNAQNLILNGSFQERNTCTEYNAQCAPTAWKTLNLTADNYIYCYGREGVGSTVIMQKSDEFDYRVYIKTRLLCPMMKDSVYNISFYTKSNAIRYNILGFLFTNGEVFSPDNQCMEAKPNITFSLKDCDIKNPEANGWVKCSRLYKANGNEAYLTIGNFTKDSDELIEWMRDNHLRAVVCEIDDLGIFPVSKKYKLCADMGKIKSEILEDTDRHTDYQTIMQRIKQKTAQLENKEYNPNLTVKKVFSPCAGETWMNDYSIDTFPISSSIYEFENNWHYLKPGLDTIWKTRQDSCLGITILVTTDGKDEVNTGILLKKAHDLSGFLAGTLSVKQSGICIKKAVEEKKQSEFVYATQNDNTANAYDIKGKIDILFVLKETISKY